jgi:FkbM family methyltransferase
MSMQKVTSPYRSIRNKVGAFSWVVYNTARLKAQIYAKGRNEIVYLDGCRFDLRNLPNTPMKLKLLSGEYEERERSAARQYIQKDWPVIELGGCIGVVACVTNRLLQRGEAHIVLEANPLVIPHLQSNRDANHCSFKIVNRAIAYDTDSVSFSPLSDLWGSSLHHNGSHRQVAVSTTQLRQIIEEEQFEKYALICDIEGQEYELVTHEPDVLKRAELIIMEVHPHLIGEEKDKTLLSKLAGLGLKRIDSSGFVVVLTRTS